MRLPLLLAASALVLTACGGTDVETAETTDTDAAVAYETDTAALPGADEPPLEGDSPFVDDGVTDAGAQDSYADANLPVEPAEVREPIGTQQATLAGQYDVMIDGQDAPATLMIEEGETPGTFTGTFDGEPVEIAQTGDRFTFDAPVTTDGEPELMTFSALSRDGQIEDGLIEAQGDGRSMGFTATRTDAGSFSDPMDSTYEEPLGDESLDAGDLGTDDMDLETTDELGAEDPLLDQ